MSAAALRCGRFLLSLDRPLVMGVVNATPDSFSDGGRHAGAQAAVAYGCRLVEEGADLLDIGGESSRPGALPVSEEEELARVIPILEGLLDVGVPLSVDTCKPRVMAEAITVGADMVNDIGGFRAPGAVEAVAAANAALVVMHMRGQPRTMQDEPRYADVVAEVASFLLHRLDALRRAGVAADRLVVDPGFGFGKTLAHNYILLRDLAAIAGLEVPILVGMSRKSMLGAVTGRGVGDREYAGVAAAVLALERGARILRVHDVAAARDAVAVWQAMRTET